MINSRVSSNMLTSRIAVDIVQKQHAMRVTQEQITTGKKINRPSDDPAYAARIIRIQETVDQLNQFQRNASTVESQLQLEETTLISVSNTLNRLRELALSANNGPSDSQTRDAVNSEVKLRLEELYQLANSRDSFGNFLFSGSNIRTPPFSGGEPVEYAGRDDTHELPVGMRRSIQTGDSGLDVFMRIRNGNGDFAVYADAANTGSGYINQGSVIEPEIYDSTPFRLNFTSPTSFDIVNDDTGAVIQAGNTYTDGEGISFNGISTSISGTPAAGDQFRILPSAQQDLFTTVSRFITTLESPSNTASQRARIQQGVDETISNLDRSLDHINNMRSRVGTRLDSLESATEENANMKLQMETTRADIEDIDIVEAVTDLQTQVNSLDILQKSYSRIEGLSLFNYL